MEIKGKIYCKGDVDKVFEEAAQAPAISVARPPSAASVINIHNANSGAVTVRPV
ncbi:MAG: hypothetical protein LBS19_10285 [Clostridiales bacterium]|nr:hypothetical protein [Clostridiales bacterium]